MDDTKVIFNHIPTTSEFESFFSSCYHSKPGPKNFGAVSDSDDTDFEGGGDDEQTTGTNKRRRETSPNSRTRTTKGGSSKKQATQKNVEAQTGFQSSIQYVETPSAEFTVNKNIKPLSERNHHPLDLDVVFVEKDHQYFFQGIRVPISVTELKKVFQPEFIHNKSFNFIMRKVGDDGRAKMSENSNSEYNGCSIREIRDKYESKGKRGTKTHALIEKFMNKWPDCAPYPHRSQYILLLDGEKLEKNEENLINQFFDFWLEVVVKLNWFPYRSEWPVYYSAIPLCGGIDAVFYQDVYNEETKQTERKYILIDWKVIPDTMSKFTSSAQAVTDGEFCYYPWETFKNSKYNQYVLQLNFYAYILEVVYKIKITSAYIVQLHPGIYINPKVEQKRIETALAKGKKPRERKKYTYKVHPMFISFDLTHESFRVLEKNHYKAIEDWKHWQERGEIGGDRFWLYPPLGFPIKENKPRTLKVVKIRNEEEEEEEEEREEENVE